LTEEKTLIPIETSRARRIFLLEISVIFLAVLAILPFSKIGIDWASFAPLYYIVGALLILSLYCHFRPMTSFVAACEVVGLGFFVTLPVLALTYVVVGVSLPLVDAHLSEMDRALGFDWLAFIDFVDARPVLAFVLGAAYQSISFQLLLIPLVLILAGKQQRAYAMMGGYASICVLASAISLFYPAVGTYAFYGLTYDSVSNIDPFFALSPVPDFNAVRAQASYTLALGTASGLLCFPSVHAGVAYLSTWAAWDVKWLRYPVLLLNILMTVAAVSHANHYFVDIISGLGVASFVCAVMTVLFYENSWRDRVVRAFCTSRPARQEAQSFSLRHPASSPAAASD